MKKITYVLLAIMLLTVPMLAFAGCKDGDSDEAMLKPDDKNFAVYTGDVAEGLSAYDLIMEAYANFLAEQNYTREEYFRFDSSVATRNTHLIRKIVGDRVYNQEVIVGTGFDSGTCAKRFYFDGEQAQEIYNTKKSDIKYNKSTGVFTVKDWGSFAPYEKDTDAQVKELREKITTYDIMTRDCLSPNHNDKVYEKDGVYYCQIKIDCSIDKMNGMQLAAKQEFLDTLGAKETGFTIKDTTIDFAIKNIDGKNKFVIWRRNEKYSGRHAKFSIEISCRQECLCTYTYGDAQITADDLLNLA